MTTKLPFAISFAVTADLALNAAAAVFGPHHFTLVSSPIGQFGALVAFGIVLHQITTHLQELARWWHRRLSGTFRKSWYSHCRHATVAAGKKGSSFRAD